LTGVHRVAQRPKRCPDADCVWHTAVLKAAAWQHLAPRYSVYGYDVIAQIGWVRQMQRQPMRPKPSRKARPAAAGGSAPSATDGAGAPPAPQGRRHAAIPVRAARRRHGTVTRPAL
jgi:hypothetical protein